MTTRKQAKHTSTSVVNPEFGELVLVHGGRKSRAKRDWVLDDRTKRVGQNGVLQIRETLRSLTPPQPKDGSSAVA